MDFKMSSSSPPQPYTIRLITETDKKKVIDFLYSSFFMDEPINSVTKLHETLPSPEAEFNTIKNIKGGCSVCAIEPPGKVIGVCLNSICRRDDHDDRDPVTNPRLAKILKFLSTLDEEADVFGKYPDVDVYLALHILSVDRNWGGKGIAKKLIEASSDIARKNDCKLLRMDCTSRYSAKAAEKLGFQPIHTIKYKDFTENGEPLFIPEEPHDQATVYVKTL